tara:strand:+ start:68 stop:334 length:267 start_codon:yes stop_codon:yes gene_type:complete
MKIVIEIITPAINADDNLAPNLQEIKLEAKNVEKTNPIIGKKIAYIIKIKAVIRISIIFPNLGQIGFMSGLKIRNKDDVIKKKETIYG